MGVAPPPPVPSGASASAVRPALAARGPRAVAARRAVVQRARTREFEREPLPLLLRLYDGTARCSRCGCCTCRSCSRSARRPTTTSPSRTPRTSAGATAALGDLIPLLGDGLLTTDGDYHRRARRMMLPAFHREQLAASTAIMVEESEAARLDGWRAGRPDRPLHVDAPAGAAHRDAGAVRLRPGSRRPRRRAWPRSSRRRSATGAATTSADAARAGHAVAVDDPRAGEPRPGDLRARSRAGGRAASAAWTSSACCSTPRTRTDPASRTRSCATR